MSCLHTGLLITNEGFRIILYVFAVTRDRSLVREGTPKTRPIPPKIKSLNAKIP